MLTLEAQNKGGQVCQHAKDGRIRCPLIIRPTSEDVITSNAFQVLRALNPRWWLPDMLNQALGAKRFRQQVYRNLKIALWKNHPAYPRELLPWDEGKTQVDAQISFENPPTTVFIEVKYGSDLSPKTSGDNGQHGFPSDQLVRNTRVGLLECGWFDRGEMLSRKPRDFALIVLSPRIAHPLVTKYRDTVTLKNAIPNSCRLKGLPQNPFIGELSYQGLIQVLKRNRRWFSRPEQIMLDGLVEYIAFKAARVPTRPTLRQENLLEIESPTHFDRRGN